MLEIVFLRSHAEFVGLNTAASNSVCGSSVQWLPLSKIIPDSKSHSAGHNIQASPKTPKFRTYLHGIVSKSYPNSVESSFHPHTRFCLRLLLILSSYAIPIATDTVTRLHPGSPENFVSVPGMEKEIISSPNCTYRPWSPPKVIFSGCQGLFPWG